MPALLGKTSTLLLSLQLRDPYCSFPSNWGIPLQPWWAQPLFPEAPTRRWTGSLPSRAAEEAAAAAINRCRRRCTHQYRPNVLQMPLCARAAKRTALDGDVTRTCEADGCLVQARMQREQGLYLSAHISGADDVLVIRGLPSSKTSWNNQCEHYARRCAPCGWWEGYSSGWWERYSNTSVSHVQPPNLHKRI